MAGKKQTLEEKNAATEAKKAEALKSLADTAAKNLEANGNGSGTPQILELKPRPPAVVRFEGKDHAIVRFTVGKFSVVSKLMTAFLEARKKKDGKAMQECMCAIIKAGCPTLPDDVIEALDLDYGNQIMALIMGTTAERMAEGAAALDRDAFPL